MPLLSYSAIFVASLCGYAGLPVWVVGAATIALASLSYAENYFLYRRGANFGLFGVMDATLLRSVVNAFFASAAAYAFGAVLRIAAG
jgi:hypothetical protein